MRQNKSKGKKTAILVLAHAGTEEALKTLKEFSAQAGPEMRFWTEQAIGECQLFMENN